MKENYNKGREDTFPASGFFCAWDFGWNRVRLLITSVKKENTMRTLKTVFVVLAFLLLPAYSQAQGLGNMRVSYIEGDVQIMAPETEDWGAASINGPLMEGDQIWVPEGSRVELQLNTGTYIRLDQNSALQILSLDRNSSQFNLSQGHAYIYYRSPKGSVVQIDTPDVSTRAFSRAVFRVDMSDEYQYTDVSVYKGYVETENEGGRTRVDADQMVSLGQNTNAEVAPMGPADEWERWNKSRNDIIQGRRSVSSRYLPPELSAYSSDFDTGGRWVVVAGYGRCWTPTISVGVDWAPYRDGRWIWRGGEYVWVSYDPWGWAPYHYGRWTFVARFGWLWVPPVRGDVYWGPGYVGWVRTGDYVAWVPLAPGELYYGRGNYGRHSVNITNVNITTVNVTNVYKNVSVNNGVTVVNRNTFATSSPKRINVDKSVIQKQLFVKNNISVGAPAIKPTRESYFASEKRIAPAKLPPQTVKSMQVKQLKQSRPFVKDPGKSVFNPGVKPKPLPLTKVATPRTPGKVIPQVKSLEPGLKGKAGVSGGLAPRGEKGQIKQFEKKAVTPPAGPAPKEEKGQIKRLERKPVKPEGGLVPPGEKGQIKQLERKPVKPEGGLVPPGEKGQMKQLERKPVKPEGGLVPPGEKGQMKQLERKPVKPEGGLVPPGEKGQIKQLERKPVKPEGGPAPKEEKGQMKQLERKPVKPEGGPVPQGEKGQIKQLERKPVKPEGGPAPKEEKGQMKQLERRPVTPPAVPAPKEEKGQMKQLERRPVTPPAVPAPKSVQPEKLKPKPENKTDKEVDEDKLKKFEKR
jgi:hypothetical protein